MNIPSLMTIEELSRRSGITTRNIREFQTKDLLPPPRRLGRVGYYTVGHLDRLGLVTSLQGRGFGIDAIRELLEAHRDRLSVGQVLGVGIMLASPWVEEEPTRVSREELRALLPDAIEDPFLHDRAVEMGLLAVDGDGYQVPSMRILRAGAELVAMGVPFGTILDEAAALQEDAARMAARFFHLVGPALKRRLLAHEPVDDTLERLRPLSVSAVEAFLRQAMRSAEERAVAGLATGDADLMTHRSSQDDRR